jgi:hypothetical protein
MSDLYFEYETLDGYIFKGFIQTIEVTAKGIITIWYGKELKEFIPHESDIYRCGESHRWMKVSDNDTRWFQQ